jgi:hypothetical protein
MCPHIELKMKEIAACSILVIVCAYSLSLSISHFSIR